MDGSNVHDRRLCTSMTLQEGHSHSSSSIGKNVTLDVICFIISRISPCTSFSVFSFFFFPPAVADDPDTPDAGLEAEGALLLAGGG